MHNSNNNISKNPQHSNKNTLELQYTKASLSSSNNFASLVKSIEQRQKYTNAVNAGNNSISSLNTNSISAISQNYNSYNNYNNQFDKQNYQNNQSRYSFKNRSIRVQNGDMTRSSFVGSFLDARQKQRQNKQYRDKFIQKEREKQNMQTNQNIQSLLYKIKKYISITQPLLQNPIKIQERLRKQGMNTACELVELITIIQEVIFKNKKLKDQTLSFSSLNNTTTLSLLNNANINKSLSSSHNFYNPNQDSASNFIRKIQNLEQQKQYLESKISQQQRANIKMFIKLNEGQSKEIEKYKKQLSSLYEKYKELEMLVKKEAEKSRILQLKLDHQSKIVCNNSSSNYINNNIHTDDGLNYKKQYEKISNIVIQQNQCLAKAYENIEGLKRKLENICNQGHIHNFNNANNPHESFCYQQQLELQERNKENIGNLAYGYNSCNGSSNNELCKSVSSNCTVQSSKNRKNSYNNQQQQKPSTKNSQLLDTSQIFTKVVLKMQNPATDTTTASIKQSKPSKSQQDLLRILYMQAATMDSFYKK